MSFTPNTIVYLLNVPIDNRYNDQLDFSGVSSQFSYFSSRIVTQSTDFTFQRKDNTIRWPANIESLWNVNYCMFRNANFGGKWFYAFITKMEYINQNMTLIHIETDVYQTWLTEAVIHPSFVMREHVSDDTIGAHIFPEQLETGDYITDGFTPTGGFSFTGNTPNLTKLWVIVGVSEIGSSGSMTKVVGGCYGNIYSGVRYYAFDIFGSLGIPDSSALNAFITNYTASPDGIVCMFMMPGSMLPSGTSSGSQVPIDNGVLSGGFEFSPNGHPATIDGYTPKNNKLFTYPYCFLHVANNHGQSNDFHYEYFQNGAPKFKLQGNVAPNASVICVPENYKGSFENYDEALTLSNYPHCAWNTDSYKGWLQQNAVSIPLGIMGGLVSTAAGVATGSVVGTASGALSIGNEIGQIYEHSLSPAQLRGNSPMGSINCAIGAQDFYFYCAHIKAEFAQIIDNFFEYYGYKVNTVKIPNINNRPAWNYVKTIDINITGAIPNDDMSRLKKMYNDGVTFWHNPSTILDYSQNNH